MRASAGRGARSGPTCHCSLSPGQLLRRLPEQQNIQVLCVYVWGLAEPTRTSPPFVDPNSGWEPISCSLNLHPSLHHLQRRLQHGRHTIDLLLDLCSVLVGVCKLNSLTPTSGGRVDRLICSLKAQAQAQALMHASILQVSHAD